jgi:hypothetical protein
MIATIDSGRVNQFRRQGIKISPKQEYRQRQTAGRIRKDQPKVVISQPQLNNDYIKRNDINLNGNSEQKNETQVNQPASSESKLTQTVRSRRGEG